MNEFESGKGGFDGFKRGVKEHSSILLAVGAVFGVFASVIFTAKGQKKADDILAERDEIFNSGIDPDDPHQAEIETPPSFKEKFDLTWKCYAPAAVSVLFTCGCIIGGTYISWRKIVGLTGTVSFLVAERGNLEKAVREKFGDEAVDEIKQKLAGDRFKKVPPEEKVKIVYEEVPVEDTKKGNTLFYDMYCGRLFRCSMEAVKQGFKDVNKEILESGYGGVCDLHYLWGLKWSDFAGNRGWFRGERDNNVGEEGLEYSISEGYNEQLDEPMYLIQYLDDPYEEYWEYY